MSRPTVLIAVDFATHAAEILLGSLELIRTLDAEVVLLHMVDTGPMVSGRTMVRLAGGDSRPAGQLLEEDARAHLQPLLRLLEQAEVPTRLELRHGDVVPGIWTAAEELDVAMVVIGSDVPVGLRRLLGGSFTDAVLRDATRPVLVVRAQTDRATPGPSETQERVRAEADG